MRRDIKDAGGNPAETPVDERIDRPGVSLIDPNDPPRRSIVCWKDVVAADAANAQRDLQTRDSGSGIELKKEI